MESIWLYNTLTRKREHFKPLHDKTVGLYACGPTPYYFAHIGNLRSYTFEDVLRRTLEYFGYSVKHVMNITDVGHLTQDDTDSGEDKVEKAARESGKNAWDLAAFYTNAFFEDEKQLNVLQPTIVCKATDHIAEQIDLIKTLERKGFTYEIPNDGVYFDSSKFKDYGKLAKLQVKKLKKGARVKFNVGKKHASDFALWKFSPQDQRRQMEWGSPWGMGFPGWHVECSAMSMKYLGAQFDIHCGGIDHIPVHHSNEIAQSESATGKKPFVKYWLHNHFLQIGKEKMAKRSGTILTLDQLKEHGIAPLDYRYYLLTAHYRKALAFSIEEVQKAGSARKKLNQFNQNLQHCNGKKEIKGLEKQLRAFNDQFEKAISDDLNSPKALSALFNLVRKYNAVVSGNSLNETQAKSILAQLKKWNSVLAMLEFDSGKEPISKEAMELVFEREKLRKEKRFAEADEIRKRLMQQYNVQLEDTAEGTKWKLVETK